MFYGDNSEESLFLLRKMIGSDTEVERRKALLELAVYVKKDIKRTMEVMNGHPVTIRLLDPPLHEFVPHDKIKIAELSHELGIKVATLRKRVIALHENNPMLGHRGVCLLYTSDAADERSSVDLGGRRIIKKNNNKNKNNSTILLT